MAELPIKKSVLQVQDATLCIDATRIYTFFSGIRNWRPRLPVLIPRASFSAAVLQVDAHDQFVFNFVVLLATQLAHAFFLSFWSAGYREAANPDSTLLDEAAPLDW